MKVGLIKEKLDGYVKRGEDGGVNWGKGGNERKFDIMSHGWWRWGGSAADVHELKDRHLLASVCVRACVWPLMITHSVRAELNLMDMYPQIFSHH